MEGRRSRSFALTVSLALHGVAAVILALWVLVDKDIVPNPFEAEVTLPPPPTRPRVRRPVVKPIPKPIPIKPPEVLPVPAAMGAPRSGLAATKRIVKTTSVQPSSVLAFAPKAVTLASRAVQAGGALTIRKSVAVPPVVTTAELPVSEGAEALAYAAPVRRGAGGGAGGGIGLGRQVLGGGRGRGARVGGRGIQAAGISLVEHIGAVLEGIEGMPESLQIGAPRVLPLPKGEPGGRIVGRGKDIRGVFRLVRVRHNLSDWWADMGALLGLAKWLNERTQIRTDLNVEGGAVALTDAALLKSPLLWMTGHDPSFIQNRLGAAGGPAWLRGTPQGRYDNVLSPLEAANLRRYLVEKQGVLIFDDCGMTRGPRTVMTDIFIGQLRLVMPEYGISRIPNTHEIYRNYYDLGGPPIGFDIFWWGTRVPRRNHLEGILIGDRISSVIVRRDYMCAMETIALPTKEYLPRASYPVFRWATNVVVYALTHGNIADYHDYVPENPLATEAVPMEAPQSARIRTTPIEKGP